MESGKDAAGEAGISTACHAGSPARRQAERAGIRQRAISGVPPRRP